MGGASWRTASGGPIFLHRGTPVGALTPREGSSGKGSSRWGKSALYGVAQTSAKGAHFAPSVACHWSGYRARMASMVSNISSKHWTISGSKWVPALWRKVSRASSGFQALL